MFLGDSDVCYVSKVLKAKEETNETQPGNVHHFLEEGQEYRRRIAVERVDLFQLELLRYCIRSQSSKLSLQTLDLLDRSDDGLVHVESIAEEAVHESSNQDCGDQLGDSP